MWVIDRYGVNVMPIDEDKASEFIVDDTLIGGRSLITKLAASHWGYVNKNGFYYDPSTVDGSIPTWTLPYHKPVLTYHPRSDDGEVSPIGRIVGSRYVTGIAREFIEDDIIPDNVPDGHLEFIAKISDPDAIPKVLDGRYDTVSISAIASNVICSICGDPAASKNSDCKHQRFKRYTEDGARRGNGKLCYYKAGPLLGRHVAFVITPSDIYAGVKSAEWEGELAMDAASSLENAMMELFIVSDNEQMMMSLHGTDSTNLFSLVEDKDSRTAIFDMMKDTTDNNGKEGKKVPRTLDIDDIIMLTDAEIDTEVAKEDTELAEDAKLSYAARKGLPDSAFCGPDRSFPAHDAAHVRNGLARLNQSKGKDKEKILSCLRSRAKKYGIKVATKVNSSESDVEEVTIIDTLLCDATIEDILELQIVSDYMNEQNANDDSTTDQDDTSTADTTNVDSTTDTSTDSTTDNTTTDDTTGSDDTTEDTTDTTDDNTDSTTDTSTTGKEVKDLTDEVAAIAASKSEIYMKYKKMLIDSILQLKINSRQLTEDNREDYTKELNERSVESLEDTLADLPPDRKVLDKVASNQVDGGRDPDILSKKVRKENQRDRTLEQAGLLMKGGN